MQSARPAKGHQGEVARIVSAFDGNHANSFLHGRVHYPHHARSKLLEGKITLLLLKPLRQEPYGFARYPM